MTSECSGLPVGVLSDVVPKADLAPVAPGGGFFEVRVVCWQEICNFWRLWLFNQKHKWPLAL